MKKMLIDKQILEAQEEIVGIRREIHQLPELMFDTIKTSKLVADKLRFFGVDEVVKGVKGFFTSVVKTMTPQAPKGGWLFGIGL